MIHYLEGDATEPIDTQSIRIIAHICNDIGKWGRGFVVSLSDKWPQTKQDYKTWYAETKPQAEFKLGTVQFVPVEHGSTGILVANMIAQHRIRTFRNPRYVPIRYEALKACLDTVAGIAESYSQHNGDPATIHMPRIGTNNAGGSWDRIEPIIEQACANLDVYVYDLPD